MTQIVASRPAPQTQTRGRRRVLLGLLGALIPPAASAPVRTCRGLLTPHSGFTAFPQQCCSFDLSTRRYFISGLHWRYRTRGSACHQHRGFQSQGCIRTRHPQQLQPAGTDQLPVPPWWCTSIQRIVSSLPCPPSSVWAGRGCFSGVSPKTTRERRQLGGASGATGDHGCILNGAMWKAESIFRLNLITLIVLELGTSWEMLIKTQSSHG